MTQSKPPSSISTQPMHTTTWRAASGYEETYHCFSWDDFHAVAQAMHARGFRRMRWIDRTRSW